MLPCCGLVNESRVFTADPFFLLRIVLTSVMSESSGKNILSN